jgi:hypothetical protein
MSIEVYYKEKIEMKMKKKWIEVMKNIGKELKSEVKEGKEKKKKVYK